MSKRIKFTLMWTLVGFLSAPLLSLYVGWGVVEDWSSVRFLSLLLSAFAFIASVSYPDYKD